jgi:tetratricopeptide (TPR) repeat protein
MAESESLTLLREKLEYLREQEAITANPSQKFELYKQIKEIEDEITRRSAPASHLPTTNYLHQLPDPPRDFVGRETELQELHEGMKQGGVSISGLAGMGGVGKTALALQLGAELAAEYPDAALYLDLRGVEPPSMSVVEALQFFIRVFEPTAQLPDDEAQLQKIYRSLLNGKRALLVLDNARDRAQVEPLLPPAACGCGVIVTSRQHFYVGGLKLTHLDKMKAGDARTLLLKIAPRIGDTADELAQKLGYLPLALRLAASFLAERPNISAPDYLRRLNNILARPEMGPVEASLSLSYDPLDAPTQRHWCALSIFPDTFDDAAAAAVWAMEPDAAQESLGALLAYSMVEWNETTRRYRLHDLARDFAGTRLSENQSELYAAQLRHATHYEQVLRVAKELFLEGHDAIVPGLKLFDDERPNIEAGQMWARTHAAQDSEAAYLSMMYPNAGVYVLAIRQHPRELIAWLEAQATAARQLKRRDAEGVALGNLGIAYADLGEARRAIEYHEKTLIVMQEIGDRRGEGVALGGLGLAYYSLGETRRAIEYHEKRLVIAEEIGDRRGEGVALGGLGIAYADLGETRRAIEYHEKYLAIAGEIGDRRGEGTALGNLGNAYADLGETQRAIEYHEKALVIAGEIGDRRGEGGASFNMALALVSLGETEQAIELAQAALTIFEAIEDPHAPMVRVTLARWRGEVEPDGAA